MTEEGPRRRTHSYTVAALLGVFVAAVLVAALSRLLVTIERYPDLKANENFIRLQDEIANTENRISVERRRFNQTVQTYNQKVRSFPTNLLAGMFGFQQRPYFQASPESQTAPKVDFSSN